MKNTLVNVKKSKNPNYSVTTKVVDSCEEQYWTF